MQFIKHVSFVIMLIASLLAVSLRAQYETSIPVEHPGKKGGGTQSLHTKPNTTSHTVDPHHSVMAGRLLSGTVAYGTQYWSYAKADWMEPIWQSQGKQLYTSLDYMNHLHKSNRHSHEIGSGLVLWQQLTSGTELGLGTYWLNYNSWHNLRHHGLRLGGKVIWQDWHLTGNGFFGISKARLCKQTKVHPYYIAGAFDQERVLNGVDMILGKQTSTLDIQAMTYHYPSTPGYSRLLTTGLGLKISNRLSRHIRYPTQIYISYKRDKIHGHISGIGARITTRNRRYLIEKTDTDLISAQRIIRDVDNIIGGTTNNVLNTTNIVENFIHHTKNSFDNEKHLLDTRINKDLIFWLGLGYIMSSINGFLGIAKHLS